MRDVFEIYDNIINYYNYQTESNIIIVYFRRRGKCRQVWMADKESGGPSFGEAYGKKWLSLRRLILPETGAIK